MTILAEDKMHEIVNYSDTSGCVTEDEENIREISLAKRRENEDFQTKFEAFNASLYDCEDSKSVIIETERLTKNVLYDNCSGEAKAVDEMTSKQQEIQRDPTMEPVSDFISKPYYKTEQAKHEPMDDDRNSVFEQDIEEIFTSSDDDCIEVEYVPSEPWQHTKLRTPAVSFPVKSDVIWLHSTDSEDSSSYE